MKTGIILVMAMLFWQCSPKKAKTTSTNILNESSEEYEQIAKKMCDCSAPLFDLYNSMAAISEEDKPKQQKQMKKRLIRAEKEAEKCFENYASPYIKNKTLLSKEFFEIAIKKECPQFYYMLKLGKKVDLRLKTQD